MEVITFSSLSSSLSSSLWEGDVREESGLESGVSVGVEDSVRRVCCFRFLIDVKEEEEKASFPSKSDQNLSMAAFWASVRGVKISALRASSSSKSSQSSLGWG